MSRLWISTEGNVYTVGWGFNGSFLQPLLYQRVGTEPDPTVPNTTITSSPPNPSTSAGASFSFTSSVSGSTFECKLDSGTFAACANPIVYTGLANGEHTFQVRAVKGGETDPSPAIYTWTINTSTLPPKVVLISPNGNIGNLSNPTYTWQDVGNATHYQIGLRDPAWAPFYGIQVAAADVCSASVCSAPHSLMLPSVTLANGQYTWYIRAYNALGSGPWSAPMVFTIQSIAAPDTQITSQPANPTNSVSASFHFTSTQAGSTFECKLDSGTFAACPNPMTYTSLSASSHTFQVRAVNSGVSDPSPASYTWTIDTTPPDTQITSKPADPSNSANASFAFTATEAGSTFECKLDSGTFAACTSPMDYSDLSNGLHTFQVRAKDGVGNVDSTPASYTWTIETRPTPPEKTTLTSPRGNIETNRLTYSWDRVTDATWYYLWINDSAGNIFKQWYTSEQVNCNGTICSVTPTGLTLKAGHHTWWVQTWNEAGLGPWSEGMSFTPTPPGKASLTSPNTTITDRTPLYTWNEVSGSSWYYLWVDGLNGNVIKQWYKAMDVCSSGTCSIEDPTNLTGGEHTWWIQTWNEAGVGPWSDGMSFNIPMPDLPGKTILTSPNGIVGTKTATYTWEEVNGSTWYYLWVDGPNGNVIKKWYKAMDVCSSGTCSITDPTILGNGAHIWWVQTWNEAGMGPWSDGMSFTFTSPAKATLTSPNGSTDTNTPTYIWREVPGSTWYYLWVDGPSGTVIQKWYTAAEANCNGTTCSITPSPSLSSGAHKWWIQTWNEAGYGPWSEAISFQTP